ncbi:MAG: hypothetical protein U1F11_06585 [Steroidobacteraceae bacterium]
MSHERNRRLPLAATGALLALLAATSDLAAARERPAGAGARGAAAAQAAAARRMHADRTRVTQTQRTDNGFTRSTTVTNGKGETATRDVAVTHERGSGLTTRSVDYTTFDGRSGSVDTTRTRTDTGFRSETTGTRPDGSSFSRSVVKDCDRDARRCTTTVTHDGTPVSNGAGSTPAGGG